VGCGTVSTGKMELSAAEYCLHLSDKLWKNNGILLTQIGKLCLIFQSITTCFPIPWSSKILFLIWQELPSNAETNTVFW